MKSNPPIPLSRVLASLQKLLHLDRRAKTALLMATDAMLCVVAVWIAFSIRLGVWDLWNLPTGKVIVASLAAWALIFTRGGIYRSVVRFVGGRTMLNILTSCVLMAVVLAVLLAFAEMPGVPRTLAVLQPMIFAALLIMSRLLARYILLDLVSQRDFSGCTSNVLIYGAGSAGRQLAVSLRHEPGMILRGYIDDDERLTGQHLDHVRIYGIDEVARLVSQHGVDTILLAMPRLTRTRREEIVRNLADISVRVLTLPTIGNLVDGTVSINDLREIQITDLLGRDPVPPNHLLLHRTIMGRVVLVTGAGGSIGSELCRQIHALKPSVLVLVEMTEFSLYSIEHELREAQRAGEISQATAIHAELANISEKAAVQRLFARWRPQTVFHAAAYKHVPLVEENPVSGVRNNVFATLWCALEARRAGAQHFILVSTDKAVRPTNIMGASKRICELVLQGLSAEGGSTRFTSVRFGNVLGSSGSVVPRFQQQIRDGGPVTLTHRDVTRYFMTIPEASQLVIQAGAMGEGGEVFVLDMGNPIRIYDLARTMINLSGLTVKDEHNPQGDIEIREVGLRKGEKLYEELLIGNSPQRTAHPRIVRAREAHLSWAELSPVLEQLDRATTAGDRTAVLQIVAALVPEYSAPKIASQRTA